MYFDSTSKPSCGSSQWDPDTVLELENPLTGCITCVGGARTYSRRCKRRVGGISFGKTILHSLSTLDPKTAAQSPKLSQAASSMLCYQHGTQASEVASKWEELLEQHAPRTEERPNSRRHESTRSPPTYASGRDAYDDLLEKLRELEEELQKFRDQERRRTAEEEERKRKQQQQERETREREARKREATDREQARKSTKEKKDEAEKQFWADVWTKYSSEWEAIEANNERGRNKQVPWPTKSGKWQDVTEAEIRRFFLKAQPVQLSANPEEETYRLMTLENKRWHTDKITSRFGRCIFEGPQGDALNMIAKVVVQLWKEAKMLRKI